MVMDLCSSITMYLAKDYENCSSVASVLKLVVMIIIVYGSILQPSSNNSAALVG
jgi:hypothetical protein